MKNKAFEKVEDLGNLVLEGFHYLALFVIGATIIWSAAYEYINIMAHGHAKLKDILLLFIYLELGAMISIYFKTHRLPVQYLIYIAITALSRHLVIDVQDVSENYHLYLLMVITGCIVALSFSILVVSYTGRRFGRPEDDITKKGKKKKQI